MKLHEFIETRRGEILELCLDSLRARYGQRSEAELLAHIPDFLDQVVAHLRRDATLPAGAAPALSTWAAQRAVARKRQGFDVTRVVYDYGMVCDKVNEVAARHGTTFSADENRELNIVVDRAVAAGVEAFQATTQREAQLLAEHIGSFAHEVRNAAHAALLSWSLIHSGRVGVAGKTADVLARALKRVESMVRDTLVEAQLGRGAAPRSETVAIADVLAESAEAVFPGRRVRVVLEVEPRELKLQGDWTLLSSAVTNLVLNATQFSRDDTVVALRARQEAKDVVIEIDDRCGGQPRGLPADELFQSFVRSGRHGRGMGLGLGIVRRAVEAHGGRVDAENVPGEGCRFRLTLPAGRDLEHGRGQVASSPPRAGTSDAA